MSRILVHYPNKKHCRLWCNTTDQWVSEKMTKPEMVAYLATEGDPKKHTIQEAAERVFRVNYDRRQLSWLKRFFDSRISSLTRASNRISRGDK